MVELLVVIAVIAIIAAIAIPNIANITGAADEAKTQRNAQSFASVAASARAAGYSENWDSVEAAVTALDDGVPGGAGMDDMIFQVPGLSADERAQVVASGYLSVAPGEGGRPDTLVYTITAAAGDDAPPGGDDAGDDL